MSRPLVLIAIFGLATSAVSFSLAASLDRAPFAMDWPRWSRFTITDACPGTSERKMSDLAWSGDGRRLVIEVPATLTVTTADERRVAVEGPAAAVDNLGMEDGRLFFRNCAWNGNGLAIKIASPAIPEYAIHGVARVGLEGLQQKAIEIAVTGAGRVTASGSVDTATITITGSGRADFGSLAVEHLTATVTGSGRTTLAPRRDADLRVTGSGRVNLATRPEHLTTRVTGSGRIVEGRVGEATP